MASNMTVQQLDLAYVPFPPFERWRKAITLDLQRWRVLAGPLEALRNASPELLRRAGEIAKRVAAIETGAIEGLYETDRGFTYTVAFETAAWTASIDAKEGNVRALFDAQLRAYEFVLDLATRQEPLSEASIRVLHEQICAAQDKYLVWTAIGPQEQTLERGVYKRLPNHVRTRTGSEHSYAPVEFTSDEMMRLLQETRTGEFQGASPIEQAAYVHYCLVAIHPFADGNGRVARALASVFTYRSLSMPIVILAEHKNSYFEALEQADAGNFQPFLDFIFERIVDTMRLVEDSFLSAKKPSLESAFLKLTRVFAADPGFSVYDADAAAKTLLAEIKRQAGVRLSGLSDTFFTFSVGNSEHAMSKPGEGYRYPLDGSAAFDVTLNSTSPAEAESVFEFAVFCPQDINSGQEIIVQAAGEKLSARLSEVQPYFSSLLSMRVELFLDRVLGKAFLDLVSNAQGNPVDED